jgi:DNA-binding winged helix-turn-helix (wHTH) protein
MMKVRFGEFTLDPAGQELLRAGEPVHLTPKVMRLLELLIENRGRLVQLREIYDRLWPDVVVSDVNVRNSVAVLRAALDDHERDGRFIRSIHNRGYMFRGEMIEVSEESRAAGGSIRHGDDSFRLRDGRNIVGRDDDCWLRLADPTVSRHHAAIVVSGRSIALHDLGSKNGTFVDGTRITAPFDLSREHTLAFGQVETLYTTGTAAPSTKTI